MNSKIKREPISISYATFVSMKRMCVFTPVLQKCLVHHFFEQFLLAMLRVLLTLSLGHKSQVKQHLYVLYAVFDLNFVNLDKVSISNATWPPVIAK